MWEVDRQLGPISPSYLGIQLHSPLNLTLQERGETISYLLSKVCSVTHGFYLNKTSVLGSQCNHPDRDDHFIYNFDDISWYIEHGAQS